MNIYDVYVCVEVYTVSLRYRLVKDRIRCNKLVWSMVVYVQEVMCEDYWRYIGCNLLEVSLINK